MKIVSFSKKVFILFLLVCAAYVHAEAAPTKQEQWQESLTGFEHLHIFCPYGCSPETKDTATALTLLGFPVSRVYEAKKVPPFIEFSFCKHLMRLERLLKEFYKKHSCVDDQKLVIEYKDGLLVNKGRTWDVQGKWTAKERQQKLKQYQQEIDDFGQFLKKHYLRVNVHSPHNSALGENRAITASQDLEGRSWLSSFGPASRTRPIFIQESSSSGREHLHLGS